VSQDRFVQLFRAMFRGGFIGGLVALIGSFMASTVFHLHQESLQAFEQEEALAAQLVASTRDPGVYLLPDTRTPPAEGVSIEDHVNTLTERIAQGPVAFVAIRPGEDRTPLQARFYMSLLIHLSLASFLTLLGWKLRELSWRERTMILAGAMLAGVGFILLNHMNQWYFGWNYTRDTLLAAMIAWIPAVMVIGWATGAGRNFTAETISRPD
jgi:hypothetical protein